LKRSNNVDEVYSVTQHYQEYFTFEEESWLSNPNNAAIVEGENVGFAELKDCGVYWVHFCFHTARGRQAVDLTKRMLSFLFDEVRYNSLVGLIAEDNRKARWLIRQVGFKSVGMTDTPNGVCEMFIFTRKDLNGI